MFKFKLHQIQSLKNETSVHLIWNKLHLHYKGAEREALLKLHRQCHVVGNREHKKQKLTHL